ncbi:hypothetical protein KIN20_026738 [Parelaphostrongylus tenuis]|uniref:Uncharacterized protein n=1 Tax=Parelaphostrongylus tenuis TaxID=148309 RepID=A0AAD5WD29_PARTN|nr:hypothetical protein KIN20_026738 [Parelaphostrongylus tenuis]
MFKVLKIKWTGNVMRFNADRWSGAVTDRLARYIESTTRRSPIRWLDFVMQKEIEREYHPQQIRTSKRIYCVIGNMKDLLVPA